MRGSYSLSILAMWRGRSCCVVAIGASRLIAYSSDESRPRELMTKLPSIQRQTQQPSTISRTTTKLQLHFTVSFQAGCDTIVCPSDHQHLIYKCVLFQASSCNESSHDTREIFTSHIMFVLALIVADLVFTATLGPTFQTLEFP